MVVKPPMHHVLFCFRLEEQKDDQRSEGWQPQPAHTITIASFMCSVEGAEGVEGVEGAANAGLRTILVSQDLG